MNDLIKKQFLEYLTNEGKASGTIQSYSIDIKLFLEYLNQTGSTFTGEISRIEFISYKEDLIKKNAKPATINKKLNSILAFNNFLIEQNLMKKKIVHPKRDKIRIAYGSEQQVTILKDQEIDKLLSFIQEDKKVSIRNQLIIYLLLYTGVRVTELINIKVQNIDFLSRCLTINFGKGGVSREIPLNDKVLDKINSYLDTERSNSCFNKSQYLLLSQRSNKMHRDAISRVLNRVGKKLNIHLHPHIFRHTIFSKLVKKGIPISTVAQLAGHSNIQTTITFYINTSREDKRSAIDLL